MEHEGVDYNCLREDIKVHNPIQVLSDPGLERRRMQNYFVGCTKPFRLVLGSTTLSLVVLLRH
jgi:hypothetical protein